MKPVIVELTHDHLVEWYGDGGRAPTVRGIAGYVDGKLVAVAGFIYGRGKVIAFCDLKDEARPHKAAIHRNALRLIADAKTRHKRLLAVCDITEPTSAKWLRRLGFSPEEGNIWSWQI